MRRLALKHTILAASSLLLLGLVPVHAGQDTARTEAYFAAITKGNPETIASYYADDAEFRWVGGPLAGLYKGREKIRGVWQRFTSAAGKFSHEVLEMNEINSGTSTIVTAKVRFKGDGDVPVKFAITYRDGKIVSETWQVDKAGVAAKTEPKPDVPDATAQIAPPPASGIRPETIATIQVKPEAESAEPPQPEAREAKPQPAANAETAVKAEAKVETAAKPETKPAAQEVRQAAPQPEPRVAAAEEKKPDAVPAAAETQGAADQTATAGQDTRPDYLPKNATSGGKSGKAGSAEAKSAPEDKSPSEARSAPRAKVAKKAKRPRRRIDIYEDDDDEDIGYGYGYGGYRRYDRYYEPRGYYGDYRGYRGFRFGYGRFGFGY